VFSSAKFILSIAFDGVDDIRWAMIAACVLGFAERFALLENIGHDSDLRIGSITHGICIGTLFREFQTLVRITTRKLVIEILMSACKNAFLGLRLAFLHESLLASNVAVGSAALHG